MVAWLSHQMLRFLVLETWNQQFKKKVSQESSKMTDCILNISKDFKNNSHFCYCSTNFFKIIFFVARLRCKTVQKLRKMALLPSSTTWLMAAALLPPNGHRGRFSVSKPKISLVSKKIDSTWWVDLGSIAFHHHDKMRQKVALWERR